MVATDGKIGIDDIGSGAADASDAGRWQRSGLLLREFGQQRGIPLSTLTWWRQVFRRAGEHPQVSPFLYLRDVIERVSPHPARLVLS